MLLRYTCITKILTVMGKTDPLLFYTQQDKLYPVASRDEMLRQLPALKKKFTSYAAYGNATLTEILTSQQIAQAKQLKITALASGVLKNLGNSKFEFRLLPTAAQLSAVRAIEVADFTNDGQLDILLAGIFILSIRNTGQPMQVRVCC
jgi:hypothetical protein